MKIFIYFLLIIVFLSSCDSDSVSTDPVNTSDEPELPITIKNLIGQWNWTKSINNTNQILSQPSEGNTQKIKITEDFYFQHYRNDTLFFGAKFNLLERIDPISLDTLTEMKWHSLRYKSYLIYSLTAKTFTLGMGYNTEGTKHVYTKIE